MLLHWIGEVQMIEQRNKEMNAYVADLIEKLRKNDIYSLLVKGQGIAQCYERPLWRACGDVDLYLSKDNYNKAKAFLIPLAQHVEAEDKSKLHQGTTIDGWIVELHGTMHTYISRRINKVKDEVHRDIFFNGNVRSWNDNGVQVFYLVPITMLLLFLTTLSIISMVKGLVCVRFATGVGYFGLIRNL